MKREWLIEIRKKSGLTLKEIASAASVSVQYINQIENGIRKPSVNVAKSLARILNFSWTRFYD